VGLLKTYSGKIKQRGKQRHCVKTHVNAKAGDKRTIRELQGNGGRVKKIDMGGKGRAHKALN